jgi:hypothetical protein
MTEIVRDYSRAVPLNTKATCMSMIHALTEIMKEEGDLIVVVEVDLENGVVAPISAISVLRSRYDKRKFCTLSVLTNEENADDDSSTEKQS